MSRLGKEETRWAWAAFALIFALAFLRFCCYGVEYFPQLDDYIQHHNYASFHQDDLFGFMMKLGLLASRPLSGVLDVVFWSRFWPVMIVGVALISLMWAGSAILFQRVWRKYFGTGWLFLVIYTLLPLGMEGVYWMSASTRVVPGMFFTALAMWLFQRWCEGEKKPVLLLFFLVQLVSFCFYEQDLVLCITGVFLVGILEFKEHRKRALGAFLTFANVVLYFGFTRIFSDSALYSGRASTLLPWQEGWLERVCLPVLYQGWNAFVKGGVYTAVKGFVRGLRLVFAEGHWLWLALTLSLCAGVFFLSKQRTGEEGDCPGKKTLLALLVGFLMAFAPVSIFFVLAGPWFSLRGTVPSFCGLALMADAVLGWLIQYLPARHKVTAGLAAVLAIIFSVAAVSEIHDYKQTFENDQRVISSLLAASDDGKSLPSKGKVAVFGLDPSWLTEQNFFYHEHIHGVTESDWAMTGALQYGANDPAMPTVQPFSSGVTPAGLEGKEYDCYFGFDYSTGKMEVLTPEKRENGDVALYTAGGELWGTVTAAGLIRSGER